MDKLDLLAKISLLEKLIIRKLDLVPKDKQLELVQTLETKMIELDQYIDKLIEGGKEDGSK